MSNKSKELYWCDRCFNDYVEDEEEIKRTYFSCSSNQKWAKHLTTNKHIKNVKKVEDSSDCILCKFCNKNFSNEGYEIHKKRNTKLWTMQRAGAYKHLPFYLFTFLPFTLILLYLLTYLLTYFYKYKYTI